jgi:hypothetical protein
MVQHRVKSFVSVTMLSILLSLTPAMAQNVSQKQIQEYSDEHNGTVSFDFRDSSQCDQVLDNGLICIDVLPEEQRPQRQSARLVLIYTVGAITTVTTVKMYELEQNENNVAYAVTVHDYYDNNKTNIPRLLAFIKTDGSVGVDPTYPEFPPQFSPEEESFQVLERYAEEIRKLRSALARAQ